MGSYVSSSSPALSSDGATVFVGNRDNKLYAINSKNGVKLWDFKTEFDFVIDAVGFSKTRQDASALCRPGGIIAHIGLGDGSGGLDIRRMTLQEITFIGTYTYTPEDFKETAQTIFMSQMGDFGWVDERSLDQGQNAFIDILEGKVSASKIVLRP